MLRFIRLYIHATAYMKDSNVNRIEEIKVTTCNAIAQEAQYYIVQRINPINYSLSLSYGLGYRKR